MSQVLYSVKGGILSTFRLHKYFIFEEEYIQVCQNNKPFSLKFGMSQISKALCFKVRCHQKN